MWKRILRPGSREGDAEGCPLCAGLELASAEGSAVGRAVLAQAAVAEVAAMVAPRSLHEQPASKAGPVTEEGQDKEASSRRQSGRDGWEFTDASGLGAADGHREAPAGNPTKGSRGPAGLPPRGSKAKPSERPSATTSLPPKVMINLCFIGWQSCSIDSGTNRGL